MVDAQTVSIVFAGLSIGVAALRYAFTLRRAEKDRQTTLETRQAQLFMQLYDKFSQPHFNEAWQKIIPYQKFEGLEEMMKSFEDPEYARAYNVLVNYFEGVGVLVKEGLVDIRLVAELMTWGIILGGKVKLSISTKS
jgi:hypothetical protein